MTALVLYPIAVGLVLVGAALAWPVARRVGERKPDRLYWEPVCNPHDAGRRWRAVVPPRRRDPWRQRIAGWWDATAPRDPHRTVWEAMAGTGRRPLMGQPPVGSAL